MKLRESRYTSTLHSALEGHQWLTCSHQINSGKEPLYPFINSWVGHRAIQGFWRTENFLSRPGFKPWTSGTDAILTKLYGSWNFNLQQALATLPPGRKHCTHCTGGLGGQEGQSERCTKSTAHTGIQSPDHATHSNSLYPHHEGV